MFKSRQLNTSALPAVLGVLGILFVACVFVAMIPSREQVGDKHLNLGSVSFVR
jgi:hypothetical protein